MDTQMLIDDFLGMNGGRLQRCCFFGQHTMQVKFVLLIICNINYFNLHLHFSLLVYCNFS